VQLVILIDFAYTWQSSWTSEERPWHTAVVVISAFIFIGCIVITAFLYEFFASSDCRLQTFFITFTLLLSILLTALSLSPCVLGGGLLPAAVVSLYSYYLLYESLTADPTQCNTVYKHGSTTSSSANIGQTILNILVTSAAVCYAAYNVSTSQSLFGDGDEGEEAESLVSSSSSSSPKSSAASTSSYSNMDENKSATEVSDDSDSVVSIGNKQYRRFFAVLGCAAMYLTMLLTNWGDRNTVDDSSNPDDDLSKENMWIKIATQWCVILLYLWTLIAPLVLKDRDFS